MIICSKCGQQLADDTVFCDNCGSAVTSSQSVNQAGQQSGQEQYGSYTDNTSVQMQAQRTMQTLEAPAFSDTDAAVKKPAGKKPIIIGAMLAAAAAVIFTVIFLLLTQKNGDVTKYLYVKDGGLYLSDNGAKGRLITSDYDIENGFASFCKDGSKLIYSDKDGLYIRAAEENGEPVRVAKNAGYGLMSADGSNVFYLTEENSAYLYNSVTDEKEKLASDIMFTCGMSEDLRTIAYVSIDNCLYVVTDSPENKVKIDSDVDRNNIYVSKELDEFYYIKGGCIYRRSNGGEREKLISQASAIVSVDFTSGSFYYKKADGSQTALYYYSNGSSEKASDSVDYVIAASDKGDTVVIKGGNESGYKLIRNGITEKLTGEKIAYISLSDDGKTVWYTTIDNADKSFTLYRADISGNEIISEKIDDDTNYDFLVTGDGKAVYTKSDNGSAYDLYADGKKLDENIRTGSYVIYQDGKFWYMTDYDDNSHSATLKSCGENGEPVRIKRNVQSFYVASSGTALILCDVDLKTYNGDFYIFDGSEPVKVDDEVRYILSTNTGSEYLYI